MDEKLQNITRHGQQTSMNDEGGWGCITSKFDNLSVYFDENFGVER